MTQRKVRLNPAYIFTCDECGRDSFVAGMIPEYGEEFEQDVREELGVPEDATGIFVGMPASVKCPHCNTEFEAVHYADEDDTC